MDGFGHFQIGKKLPELLYPHSQRPLVHATDSQRLIPRTNLVLVAYSDYEVLFPEIQTQVKNLCMRGNHPCLICLEGYILISKKVLAIICDP